MYTNPTLDEICRNCFLLDSPDFVIPQNVRLISHDKFTSVPNLPVKHIEPNSLTRFFKRFSLLFHFFYSLQLIFAADKNTVIIATGAGGFFLPLGFLNRFFGRKILLWDLFTEYRLGTEKRLKFFPFVKFKKEWKEAIARFVMQGYTLIVVWGRKEAVGLPAYYRLPESMFIFLPFKANHSKRETFDLPMNNFVFSGGNSKRDYKTVVEAVRGTGIPLIISATDPNLRKQIELLPNVVVLGASEPAFGQLQAACRFSVVSLIDSANPGIKGSGEANFCNAMWHKKPVIAVDNLNAEDYILEGETGYIVPCGDVQLLRKRILELWNDEEKCRKMGENARKHVEKHFTHFLFIQRLLRLAMILG